MGGGGCQKQEQGIHSLYVYDTETGSSRRVFPGTANVNFMGRFSPDGTRFCYILGDDSGHNEVYVAEFTGVGEEVQLYEISMVSIPGGTFRMGDIQGGGWSDERPVHTVRISAFEMSAYEITQGQYEAVMGENPSSFRGANHPVEQVSWYDAVKFCNKLSELSGLEKCYDESTWECDFSKNGFRLPTEAEWELSLIHI